MAPVSLKATSYPLAIASAPIGAQAAPGHPRRAAYLQLRTGPPADRLEIIIVADLNQAGRSEQLDHRCARGRANHAIAVDVLVETYLSRSPARGWCRTTRPYSR